MKLTVLSEPQTFHVPMLARLILKPMLRVGVRTPDGRELRDDGGIRIPCPLIAVSGEGDRHARHVGTVYAVQITNGASWSRAIWGVAGMWAADGNKELLNEIRRGEVSAGVDLGSTGHMDYSKRRVARFHDWTTSAVTLKPGPSAWPDMEIEVQEWE